MKNTVILFFFFVLSSCHQKITQQDVAKINGYWEIEKVNLPDFYFEAITKISSNENDKYQFEKLVTKGVEAIQKKKFQKVVLSRKENYDYFEIKGNTGFRKKVNPQLNGRFLVTNQSEKVTLLFEKDQTFLVYSTPFAKWKEEIKSLEDKKMVLINSTNMEYTYKKTGPINLIENGKKTK